MKFNFVKAEEIGEEGNLKKIAGRCEYMLSVYMNEEHLERKRLSRKITGAMNDMGWSIDTIVAKEHGDDVIKMETYFVSDTDAIVVFSSATCHPDDEFDFDKGFQVALLKAVIIFYGHIERKKEHPGGN